VVEARAVIGNVDKIHKLCDGHACTPRTLSSTMRFEYV